MEKCGRQKAEKKSVNKIFPSQRNTNQNFWLPDVKFWMPIFLLRIRTKSEENAFAFGAPMAIYTPTTEKPRRMNRMLAIYAVS